MGVRKPSVSPTMPYSRQRGDVLIQRHAQLIDQLQHHFSGGGRRRIDPVDLPEARVGDVMIDVDEEGFGLGQVGPDRAEALFVAAIERDDAFK